MANNIHKCLPSIAPKPFSTVTVGLLIDKKCNLVFSATVFYFKERRLNMAKDKIHAVIRTIIQKEGWQITDDPFYITIDTTTLELVGKLKIRLHSQNFILLCVAHRSFSEGYNRSSRLDQNKILCRSLKSQIPNKLLAIDLGAERLI
ncbi:MAG: element excision factor XisH family protein [Bacteroidota bacterium]